MILSISIASARSHPAFNGDELLDKLNKLNIPETLQHATEIPDEELANLRGKYVEEDEILYFGIEMLTRWETFDGEILTASLTLHANFYDHLPKIEFLTNITIVDSDDRTPYSGTSNNSISGNGLNNISGASQTIQIAGDTNRGLNDLNLTIIDETGHFEPNLYVGKPGNSHAKSNKGAVAKAGKLKGGLGVIITIPGQGNATQLIKNAAFPGGKGLSQAIKIMGQAHQVQNLMNIRARLKGVGNQPHNRRHYNNLLRFKHL